jgi:hypothetical protein
MTSTAGSSKKRKIRMACSMSAKLIHDGPPLPSFSQASAPSPGAPGGA